MVIYYIGWVIYVFLAGADYSAYLISQSPSFFKLVKHLNGINFFKSFSPRVSYPGSLSLPLFSDKSSASS